MIADNKIFDIQTKFSKNLTIPQIFVQFICIEFNNIKYKTLKNIFQVVQCFEISNFQYYILFIYQNQSMNSIFDLNQSNEEKTMSLQENVGIDIKFKNISVSADIEDDENMRFYHFGCCKPMIKKQILYNASGQYKSGRLHALMGPSGSGKTTLINALMGQCFSKNVEVYGQLYVNNIPVKNLSEIGDQLGYVRQDDLMFPFFTPKQTFQFYLNLKQHSKSPEEKKKIIHSLIILLGLNQCQDTYIGNSMHKGLSGGEKRRTSIGIQLITDPSVIFLDEPTTGLDSSTALKLIITLKQFAKSGKNIIATMHQPSSNIFLELDYLTLLVDGHIVYNGEASESVNYFQKLYKISINKHENPLDVFMSFLTKQGIAIRFLGDKHCDEAQISKKYQKNIKKLLKHFQNHHEEIKIEQDNKLQLKDLEINKTHRPHVGRQVWYLLMRILVNTFRNKNKMFWKMFSFTLIVSFLMTILFYQKADNFFQYDTNLSILGFFYAFMISFLAVFDETINFSTDRSIFIRQSLNNYYYTSAYSLANFLGSIPLNVIVISLTWTPSYWALSTNHDPIVYFLTLLLIILLYIMIMRVCLILAILIPSQLALNMILPITLVSFALGAGFFIPLNSLSDVFKPFQAISCIKYAYQAFMQLQYQYKNAQLNEYFLQPQHPLEQNRYQFAEPLWLNFALIAVIGLVFGILDHIALKILGSAYKIDIVKDQKQKIQSQEQTQKTQKTKKIIITQIVLRSKKNIEQAKI